ncbi:MAG: adenylate/guanylate cyclase domain-containing protein [Planctomycetota bacterium]
MFGLNRLSIQSKMIALLLIVSLSSIALVAAIAYRQGQQALTAATQNHLIGIQQAKRTALKTRLESLREQVIAMSDSRLVIESCREYRTAFRKIEPRPLPAQQSAELDKFYTDSFIPSLAAAINGEPVPEQYIPTDERTRYLQYHYIASSPHPYEKKSLLLSAPADQTDYGAIHARFHPLFARQVKLFGFDDILLIDPETLDIVYNYQKSVEFGTNLEHGTYSNSRLAAAARVIRNAKDRDDYKVADFEGYRPSLYRPMGFALSPIFDGQRLIGILALQFPIESFVELMSGNFRWREEGLGDTGEVYLVGTDSLLRTRSRFMKENPEEFLKELDSIGTNPRVLSCIRAQGNVMGVLTAPSSTVERAIQGESGIDTTMNYRRREVLSAFSPIDLDSVRWVVLAEMEVEEANRPIRELARKVLVVSCGTALVVSLLALVASHMLVRPLRVLAAGARRLGEGQTDVRVDLKSQDEFGELGRVFNQMAENIQSQTDKLEHQIRDNQELLLSILPASAVAQRREGDEKASRQFTDVSVLFAELTGLEELNQSVGETRALSILGDLIADLDEAAERLGIEKVKTIGGSYLAVCGLSVSRPDHVRRIVQFAQEANRIVGVFQREQQVDLGLVVGMNAGPVVGGVVGRKKFLYDLWGDTVAIAKKLTGGNVTAALRVTTSVRERLGDQFQFEGPQLIDLPGKPSMEMWSVIG